MVRVMTDEHKAANSRARVENKAIGDYLVALEANRPKPGRKRSREHMEQRLAKATAGIATASSLQRLDLIQERIDLTKALSASSDTAVDISAQEDAFVEAAQAYSGRKGISYAAWREMGVPAAVLRRAHIARSRS